MRPRAEIPHQAVVLAGGLGTRLGPLTSAMPKPLLGVGGRPFIEYLVEHLVRHSVHHVVLLAGYRHEEVSRWLSRFRPDGMAPDRPTIEIVVEPEPMGTAGALRLAHNKLAPLFYLMNGDSFFDFNLLDLAVTTPPDCLAHLALRNAAPDGRYGRVRIDSASRRIEAFAPADCRESGPINGGVYVVRRQILDFLRADQPSLERDVFPALAGAGRLHGQRYDGFFIDIGIPDDFARAQESMPKQTRRPAVFLDRDGVLNVDSGHPHRSDQIVWIDGAKAAVKFLNDCGYFVFVVTNQGGVARGLYEESDVHALHEWMQGELHEIGAHVDAFKYCPFHPEAKVNRYRRSSSHRKPGPGMILECLAQYTVDRELSVLIGDRQTDLEAAQAAGIQGLLFEGGNLLDFVETAATIRPCHLRK